MTPEQYYVAVQNQIPIELAKVAFQMAVTMNSEIVRILPTLYDKGKWGAIALRTGGLARSFRPRVTTTDSGEIEISAYSDMPYAGIQDEGGSIFPVKVDYLTVPLQRQFSGRRVRQFPRGTFFRVGNALFETAQAKKMPLINGKRQLPEPAYALKRSVKLQGKRYTEKALDKAMPKLEDIVNKALIEAINNGNTST